MKLSVIALDYDGTIARGDKLEPSVRITTCTVLMACGCWIWNGVDIWL